MAERPIKQAWANSGGFLIGAVCEDGTAWRRAWRDDSGATWERIPGPPADPPEPVGALPEWVSVGRIAALTMPPRPLVELKILAWNSPGIVRSITPPEARALARALIDAANLGGGEQ